MVWLPTARADVVMAAWPVASRLTLPSVVVPSWKVTAPVGVPEFGALTVTAAVKGTGWPNTEGLGGEAVTLVVVRSPMTRNGRPRETGLGLKLPSPLV